MTSSTTAAHDPDHASTHVPRLSSELPSLWWGSKGLLPPIFLMLVGSGGMAGGRGARLSVTSEEAFWSSLSGGFFQAGGVLEADFCHSVGNMDP